MLKSCSSTYFSTVWRRHPDSVRAGDGCVIDGGARKCHMLDDNRKDRLPLGNLAYHREPLWSVHHYG